MKSINDYTDDELLRLLAKTQGTIGGNDRVTMIQSVLTQRGVKSDRAKLFDSLNATIEGK